MATEGKGTAKRLLSEVDISYDTPPSSQVNNASRRSTAGTGPYINYRFRKVGQGPALHEYVSTGNRLKEEANKTGVMTIESGITQFVEAVASSVQTRDVMFAYLGGSSGLGRTQLAFSIQRPVLYIPLGDSQSIYECFGALYDVVLHAVRVDMAALCASSTTSGEFSMAHIKEALSGPHELKYCTVSLLLQLLEHFATARAEGSNVLAGAEGNRATNVFLGAECDVQLEGMTLIDGQRAAEKYRDVLIYLDEIPPLSRKVDFQVCLFLRNLIRCLFLPCLLSGTEFALLNTVESVRGSRIAGRSAHAWLLTKFPATQLNPLTVQIDRFGEYEQHLLNCPRPLFAQWLAECTVKRPVVSTIAASQVDGPLLRMTPETLTDIKHKICRAKVFWGEADIQSWLHASTLLVFADSLTGSNAVATTVVTHGDAQVEGKHTYRKQVGGMRHNVMNHVLAIQKHFALLHIPSKLVDSTTAMAKLYVSGPFLENSDNSPFKIQAAFRTCAEDPLLYLVCLRGGWMYQDARVGLVHVPSSHAFTTFDGAGLGAECMAAAVVAAHRYTSFAGTPFLQWLAFLIAELSYCKQFQETPIGKVPPELRAALQDVQVPLLSPPNCLWGEESMQSGINFGNLIWCKNNIVIEKEEMGDAEEEESEEESVKETEEEEEEKEKEETRGEVEFMSNNDFKSLVLEIKDTKKNFEGDKVATVTQRVDEGTVTVLICSHLAEWTETTTATFAEDVSVYRVKVEKNKRSIERISTDKWAPGRKLLIALDLSTLHPGRHEVLTRSK